MAAHVPGVWGIDLGQCALKAIRLDTVNGEITATAFDTVPLLPTINELFGPALLPMVRDLLPRSQRPPF